MTQRNDDDAESLQRSLREGDPIREGLAAADELLRDHRLQKALISSGHRDLAAQATKAVMKIDLSLIEYDRKQREEQTQSP